MSIPLAYDVTAQTFQADVLERSMTVPVLIDFWAEWCGPCRTLGPVLEKLVADYDGAFVLAKVDSDAEIELAQAFRVQSIPFVVLVMDGRPVDGFAGALGEDKVREFLKRHGIEPAADTAADEDPDAPPARLRAAREALAQGDTAAATAALEAIPEEVPEALDKANILGGIEFLSAELAEDVPAAAELRAAREHFLAGRWQPALQAIVDSAAADRSYGDGLARKAMRLLQGTLGPTEVVDEYRRKLATLLY